MTDKMIWILFAVVAALVAVLCVSRRKKASPENNRLYAGPAQAYAPVDDNSDELMAAVLAAAVMLCLPGEHIRRITPRSYNDFYPYTIELISAD